MQSPNLLPKNGFQMEIDFLNASAPAIRGESSLGMPASQPNIIQRLLPVDSFDMTIYPAMVKFCGTRQIRQLLLEEPPTPSLLMVTILALLQF